MKWILICAGFVFVVLGATIPLSGVMVGKGLDNPGKSWAPGLTQKGARLRMLFGNYEVAAKIWEQAASTWPDHPDCPKMVYRAAFCHEKAKRTEQAIVWYKRYLADYPQHMWHGQAEKRLDHLEESQ